MNGLSSSFQHLGHRDKKRQDNQTERLKILIQENVIQQMLSYNPVDLRDENGRTPLMNAVLKGNFQEVTRLVKTGVNLFLTDSKGQNVLHLAAQHGDTNIIDVIHTCMQRIDIRAAEDMTPLMFAALGGKLQAVEWFLRKGALATHKDTRGWNVLHYAAQCGDPDTIALILPWVPNIESKTNDGLTPLLVCARHNKLQGAQYLHARGADLFATDIHGNNAMYHALSSVPFPQNLILHQMITADAMNTSVKDETTGGNEQKESGPGKATNTSVKDETTGGNEQTASGEGKATNTSVKDETTGGNEQTASGEGEDAHLPAESAKTVFEEDCLNLNEDMHSSPAKADEQRKPSKRISNGDVLKMQYECLCTQKEMLNLKKQKLKMQIHLLEQQVNANQTFATALNANFVVPNTDSF